MLSSLRKPTFKKLRESPRYFVGAGTGFSAMVAIFVR
jgi:hypothetical protein